MKGIKVITLADAAYFKYVKAFVNSCKINFSNASLHLVLVNMTEVDRSEVESMHPNIEVVIEEVDFADDLEKRCYCTNRRAHLFKYLRDKTDDMLLWVDADSIFRKDCSFLTEHLNSCELTMRRKKRADKFAAGIIGIYSTPICKEFIDYYYDLVEADKGWMSNQVHLRDAYLEFKDRINFDFLDKRYCDVWLSDDGVIWTAKSKLKNTEKYVKEMKKYTGEK